ncbi:MAG: NAD(P)/FAD-dependent oxidoreductase [Alphaproteobacteria bacterium]
MPDRPKIVVVGAGIVGAAVAWNLARAGAGVTIVADDRSSGPATRASLAWINASWGNREDYFRLRLQSMAEWRRLAEALPSLPLTWCGGLLWDLPADRLAAFAAEHTSRGYDLRLVDGASAQRIEPALAQPPPLAVHAPSEGAVEPEAAASLLVDDACARGASIMRETRVNRIVRRSGRAIGVDTDGGPVDGDAVVVAAGAGAPALAATVGLELRIGAPPVLLLVARAARPILHGLVLAPALHVRQRPDGRIVASAGYRGSDAAVEGEALAAALRSMLRGADEISIENAVVSPRPMPADGLPVVGAIDGIPGLWLAISHSGVTLAPAIGRMVAEMILAGRIDPLVAPFGARPSILAPLA